MGQGLPHRRRVLGLLGASTVLMLGGCVAVGDDDDWDRRRPVSPRPSPGSGSAPSPGTGSGGGDRATSSGPSQVAPPRSGRTDAFGIHGTVRDRAGRPVSNAFVQVIPLGADTPAVPELAVFTDGAGSFHWPLPAGRYRLMVSHERGSAEAEARVPAGGRVRLDLILR